MFEKISPEQAGMSSKIITAFRGRRKAQLRR